MAARVLIVLSLCFIGYSLAVYKNGDRNNKEGVPGSHELAGWNVWQEKNCQACHQLYGLGGYLGPDLTNVVSASGRTSAYLQAIVMHGTDHMPDFNLSQNEAADVTMFLSWVNSSGLSKVPAAGVHWTGTYNLGNDN